MISERECFVYIVLPGETEFVTAGRFTVSSSPDREPIGRFVYGRRYLRMPNAVALDPVELRLSGERYETARMTGFFGAVRDAMPDFWGRCLIERHAGGAPLEEFAYLMQGPDDRAGALGFGSNVQPSPPQMHFNRTLHLEKLQAVADSIMHEVDVRGSAAEQIDPLFNAETSMGGARPKAVVEHRDNLWIAKFGKQSDRWNNPRVERGMLELARNCGISVADSELVVVAGRDALLVRRFDRERVDSGYLRHRMISALTLMRLDDSMASRTEWSYLSLADEVRRNSEQPEEDLHQLFRRMCFNAVVSNTDDHPRNHAMIADEAGWRLSPAYDLTPSPMVGTQHRDLAMTCGTSGRHANYHNLLTAYGRFYLSAEEATAILDDVVATVRNRWRPVMLRVGVSEADCDRIVSAFAYDGFFH